MPIFYPSQLRIKRNIFEDIDWVMVVIYLALVLFGWISIYAATYDEMHPSIFDLAKNHGKQALWIGLALVIGLIMMFFDTRFFETFAYPIYGFALFLLLAVLVLGTEVKGAQSWFVLGPVSFQPSEIAKFGTALALAKYLSVYGSKFDSKKVRNHLASNNFSAWCLYFTSTRCRFSFSIHLIANRSLSTRFKWLDLWTRFCCCRSFYSGAFPQTVSMDTFRNTNSRERCLHSFIKCSGGCSLLFS